MPTDFGPWATSMHAQLSSFWKQRMSRLSELSPSATPIARSWWFVLLLFACGLAALPLAIAAPGATASPEKSEVEKKLEKEMVVHAWKAYDSSAALYRGGQTRLESFQFWSHRLFLAEMAVAAKPADRVAVIERYIARCHDIRDIVTKKYEQGIEPSMAKASVDFYYAEAQLMLEREPKK